MLDKTLERRNFLATETDLTALDIAYYNELQVVMKICGKKGGMAEEAKDGFRNI